MKIIDLLNKIANNEEVPKKIKWLGQIYEYSNFNRFYYQNSWSMYRDFYKEGNCLNDEVEIIEDPKKINKIRIDHNSINIDKAFETGTTTFFREKDIEIFQCLSSKINELIDEINNLKEK